jgi:hypothetical protein
MNDSRPYQAPVDKLLQAIEFKQSPEEWPNYPLLYGLTVADLPELMRLSLDADPVDCENYESMIHGLIAVAQLELDPIVVIDLYLQQLHLFIDDDLLQDEAGRLCRMVGKAAIEPCTRFLQNTTEDEWSRKSVVDGLEEIARFYPDCRDACVRVMIDQLGLHKLETSSVVNSSLVNSLTKLQVVEAAGLIEETFANCELDEWLTGSWPSVQVKLGLKSESDFSAAELKPTPPAQILAIRESLDKLERFQAPQQKVNIESDRKPGLFDFPDRAVLPAKKSGFGGSGVRSKKDKPKK